MDADNTGQTRGEVRPPPEIKAPAATSAAPEAAPEADAPVDAAPDATASAAAGECGTATPVAVPAGVEPQEKQQKQQDMEAAVSAALVAAAAGEQSQQGVTPGVEGGAPEGASGRASSVLSVLLSAVLRQLLPWVLPSSLRCAAAAGVEVDLAQKQLALRGVSLQPQELTALSGAPLQMLHCSIGLIRLRLGGQGKPAADAIAALGTTTPTPAGSGVHTPAGEATPRVSPAKAEAAATAAAKAIQEEGASSLVLSVKDVLIVVAPTSGGEWSRQELLDLALQRRRALLDATDRELQQQQQQQQQQKQGFSVGAYTLVSQWIDRHIAWASLEVTNLHVRVECLLPLDTSSSNTGSSTARNPFALGLTLRELRTRTLPAKEFDAAGRTVAGQGQQHQQQQEEEHQATQQADGDSAPHGRSSTSSKGSSNNSKDTPCSGFYIKDFSMYIQEELFLLAPHTRGAAETIELLGALGVEHQQEQEQQPLKRKQQQQQHRWRNPAHAIAGPLPTEEQQHSNCRSSNSSSSSSTRLLAPVTVQLFLRKNPFPESLTAISDGSSSSSSASTGNSNSNSNSSSSSGSILAPVEGSSSTGLASVPPGRVDAAPTGVTEARALRAAYVAVVDSGCLDVTLTPAAVLGIRWLAANAEQHRHAVETAEAVLSLVRPFRPSCTGE